MLRRFTPLLALAALLLGACDDLVYSRAPVLEERFRPGDAELRPGLWSFGGRQLDGSCVFDIHERVARWPDCATGVEARRGQLWLVARNERLLFATVKLAAGDPVLAQAHWVPDVEKDPRAPEPTSADSPAFGWTYGALTALRLDAAGRIMEARLAPATCAAAPALKRVKANCVAEDLAAVRQALAQAAGAPMVLRWVRDNP